MAGKAICKEKIKKNTKEYMQKLGVYKAEYDTIIDIYSELMEQYERLTKTYKESKYKIDEATADGGSKKAPIVATLESLRRDILQYSDRLCLNPKSNQADGKERKKRPSSLASALSSIET
ncbi:MAG: P27 family phage terminase small subunit [Flavobacterium sp.]